MGSVKQCLLLQRDAGISPSLDVKIISLLCPLLFALIFHLWNLMSTSLEPLCSLFSKYSNSSSVFSQDGISPLCPALCSFPLIVCWWPLRMKRLTWASSFASFSLHNKDVKVQGYRSNQEKQNQD